MMVGKHVVVNARGQGAVNTNKGRRRREERRGARKREEKNEERRD